MKKIFFIFLGFTLYTSTISADFLRIEAGLGAWANSSTGSINYQSVGSDVSTKKSFTKPYAWLLIKHPTPIIPNIRLEYSSVESNGVANGTFKDYVAAFSPTTLKMTQYDAVAYYNILDNTAWITLDLGLDIKAIDASHTAQNVTLLQGAGNSFSSSEMIVLPLLYCRTRVEIPSTEFGLEADIKYIDYSSSSIYDARVKVDYTLDIIPMINPAIEVGYRVQSYQIDDNSLTGKIDIDFSGFYAGLMMRF